MTPLSVGFQETVVSLIPKVRRVGRVTLGARRPRAMGKMTTFVLVHDAWRGGGATSRWREEDIEARRRPAPAAHPGEQFCTYVVGQQAYPGGAMHDSQRYRG
jgi:hypothetical protein